MPCVSKLGCTHVIIVSLWLICFIQFRLSISYLSIPGIVAHDRCNIFQIFIFFVQFKCPMSCCAFHLYNCFSGGFKTGQRDRKVAGQECQVIIIYFKILACLISVNVFGLFSSLFIVRFIIIIVLLVFTLLLSLLFLWILHFYTHNQYNYLNNYQIMNYSFKGFFNSRTMGLFF